MQKVEKRSQVYTKNNNGNNKGRKPLKLQIKYKLIKKYEQMSKYQKIE